MWLERKQLAWLGTGALWAIVSGAPALADETELFVGTSIQEKPNILFILDNSGSMETLVGTQTTYDPNATYTGSCSNDKVYWRTGTGSIPECSTPNWFYKTALKCEAGLSALNTAGQYAGRLAQYDPSNTSSGKRWERIDAARPNHLVECRADNGVHGDGDPANARYPANGETTAANAWRTTSGGGGFAWNVNPHTNGDYTLYSGHWLNWAHGPTGFRTRLEVVQEVTNGLLSQISGVNVGLMTFNDNQGGWVVHAMESIETARDPMKAAVSALAPTGFTPLSETLYEAAMYYTGGRIRYGGKSVASSRAPNGTHYASPLDLSCQKNFIVYLTDGEPTQDVDANSIIPTMTDASGDTFSALLKQGATCDLESGSDGRCLDDLAGFLNAADLSDLPGQQNVETYTIGFTVNLPVLAETAARGGGVYYTADNTAQLANALTNIVTKILDTEVSFTAPTVSVNSLNQTRNLNDLYVSVFTPTGTEHWPGNLKKYELRSDGRIVDANGREAINPSTGFFTSTAQSFWSETQDGSVVEEGGAAHKIPLNRKVFTYLGSKTALADASNRVHPDNNGITDAILNTGLPEEPTREEVIAFINGLDEPDGESRNEMGDPMNAQPVSVIYGTEESDAKRVYFATNDGYLHSIDTATGEEAWAFVPPEFLGDQVDLLLNNSVATKHYGLDGNLRAYISADNDGTIDSTKGEKVYLFFGMRRGGDTYYALDITVPNEPVLLWRRDSAGLPGIGQTWSTPTPTKMNIGGTPTDVLVFGGGYDPTQDDETASTDTIGNSLYIVNAESGAPIWRGTKSGGNKSFAKMDYSIPGDVKVMDLNGDRMTDRMYFADMGGQVWRFDVTGESGGGLINGGVLAQLGAASIASPTVAETRRFYYAPDVAIVNSKHYNYVHIGIGSGHRAHPNSTGNQDRFYALRDYATFTTLTQTQFDSIVPIKDGDLIDITDEEEANVPQGSPGWKFELRIGGWRGEKVLAEARTFNNKVFFNTYTPNAGTGTGCTPVLGLRRQYEISVINGGLLPNRDSRFTESDGAPLAGTQFIFVEDRDTGDDDDPDGEEEDDNGDGVVDNRDGDCAGDTCVIVNDGLNTDLDDFNTNPIRTFWRQDSID